MNLPKSLTVNSRESACKCHRNFVPTNHIYAATNATKFYILIMEKKKNLKLVVQKKKLNIAQFPRVSINISLVSTFIY